MLRRLALILVSGCCLALIPAVAQAARYDGWTITSGAEPVATIADLEAGRDAIRPGRSVLDLDFHSTINQHIRVTVLDAAGRMVRVVTDTDVAAGPVQLTWNGTNTAGVRVSDGMYEVVVEAGTSSDTLSVSEVIRVDGRAPTVAATTTRVTTSASARSFRLPISASEAALVHATVSGAAGRTAVTSARPSGRSSLIVPIVDRRRLRRAFARGSARALVRIVATDAAGNASVRRVLVTLQESTGGGSIDPGPIQGSSRLSWPLSGPLTSGYGMRWGRMHNGIDIGVPTGRRIGSAAPGRVTYAGWMSGYGNTVIVDHGPLETLYAHQSRILVRSGQSVTRGHVVGLVGSTGNSTGPHLHFEVRIGSAARNPLNYLP